MLVSQNKLAELTGKDRKTIRKLLTELPAQPGPHRARLYDSARALETIYCANGDSAFVTTAEAFRRLTIAKEIQVRVQTEIVRGERIPREDVESVCALVFTSIRGVIKASKLPIESCNEIFDSLRAATTELRQIADEVGSGNGQHPA
jgi:hypothetical protein